MLNYLLTALIITASPDTPTEIIGSAATPSGERKEIIVEQPENSPNPFGYIAPEEPTADASSQDLPSSSPDSPTQTHTSATEEPQPTLLVKQSSEVNPKDMNPLHYENKIENTIYQSGDRLIDVQSIPLKDISSAVQPNIQPTITDYPSF